jgi:WD40 repeat protein
MSEQLTSISSVIPGLELNHILQGHTDVITRIAWSPDGHTLASTSKDGTLRLWDPETGESRRTVKANAGSIYDIAWSPDGKILAIASHNGLVHLWNAETGGLSQVIEPTRSSTSATLYKWSDLYKPDLLYEYKLPSLIIAGLTTSSTQKTESSAIYGIAWSPNGRILALAGTRNDIQFFDPQQGVQVRAKETLGEALNISSLPDSFLTS